MPIADASVAILAEDQTQQNFVYHWLRSAGVNLHKIRKLPVPAGRGSGSQHVINRYREEVHTIRRSNQRITWRLVVVIDADDKTVDDRRRQLADALGEGQLRRVDDPVCVLVPRRNIETWVHALLDHGVNEVDDYKPKTGDEIRDTPKRLASSTTAPTAPPSLSEGYVELERLKRL